MSTNCSISGVSLKKKERKEDADEEVPACLGCSKTDTLRGRGQFPPGRPDSAGVKNKLAAVRKKGKVLVEKLIKPIVRAAMTPLPTGSEAPDDGEPLADPLSTLDWETLEKKAKWSNFHVYFDFFGSHPTWGLWSTGEIGSDSEAEGESQDHTPSGLSATKSSSAPGCAAATSATGRRGNLPPMGDGDTDDDEFGGLAISDASDDHDDSPGGALEGGYTRPPPGHQPRQRVSGICLAGGTPH